MEFFIYSFDNSEPILVYYTPKKILRQWRKSFITSMLWKNIWKCEKNLNQKVLFSTESFPTAPCTYKLSMIKNMLEHRRVKIEVSKFCKCNFFVQFHFVLHNWQVFFCTFCYFFLHNCPLFAHLFS